MQTENTVTKHAAKTLALTENLFCPSPDNYETTFFLTLLNNIHESIIIIDKETRVIFVNESYLKMFHVRKEKIIGHYLAKFEPLARIHDVLKTGLPINGNISFIHSANINVYADMSPLFFKNDLIGALALMKDVTELTNATQELEHFKSLSQALKKELSIKQHLPSAFHNIIGQDPNFINILMIAARTAPTDASICITGESGTGKEILAEAIHYSSHRATGPLIKINCAAIPETLIESELFGYEPGSFTGASPKGKIGKFELAEHGTIFLDEIAEMPLSMQVKLLRVLQEKKITRIGGHKNIDLDFRLITATNRNLEEMITNGTFREDLYYRVNVISLTIPPLRERPADIEEFAKYFLEDLNRQYHKNYHFTPEALFAFTNYDWPGNVRELKNYVERAAILSYDATINTDHLPAKLKAHTFSRSDTTCNLHTLLEQTERNAIANALQISKGNKTHAIDILGISRRSFYQKLEKYGLLSETAH